MLPAESVASPCIKVCILDGQGICKGCGRTLEEIASWSRLAPDQQRKVCELAATRRGPTLSGPADGDAPLPPE